MRLEGGGVVLRAFRADELDLWWSGLLMLDASAQPQGPPSRERLRRRLLLSGQFVSGRVHLAIEAEGRLVGEIQTYRPKRRRLERGVYEFGIVLFDTSLRGRGVGTRAVALLAERLSHEPGARALQGGTDESNLAMRRVFEKLGFVRTETVRELGHEYLMYRLPLPCAAPRPGEPEATPHPEADRT